MKITVSVDQYRRIQQLADKINRECLVPEDFNEEAWRIGLKQILGFEPLPGNTDVVIDWSTAPK